MDQKIQTILQKHHIQTHISSYGAHTKIKIFLLISIFTKNQTNLKT